MKEILPLLGGLLIGALYRRGNLSRVWAAAATLVVAVAATVLSGEFLISWGFLLVDIPIVVISAAVGYLTWAVWWRLERPGTRCLSSPSKLDTPCKHSSGMKWVVLPIRREAGGSIVEVMNRRL